MPAITLRVTKKHIEESEPQVLLALEYDTFVEEICPVALCLKEAGYQNCDVYPTAVYLGDGRRLSLPVSLVNWIGEYDIAVKKGSGLQSPEISFTIDVPLVGTKEQ